MYSPLEQFHIIPITIISMFQNYAVITNFDIQYILVGIIFLFLFIKTSMFNKLIPSAFELMFEELYFFILSTVGQQGTFNAVNFFPIILFNFIYILVNNLISLLPFSFSLTAEFVSVFFIALTFNVFFFYLGVYLNGFKFFRLFYRADLILELRLFLLLIEIFSYGLRTISLSVRLFANMLAGHTLLHIVCGVIIYTLPTVPFLVDIFLIFLIIAIFMLETMVAFLQAFIFTILLSLYLRDALDPNH